MKRFLPILAAAVAACAVAASPAAADSIAYIKNGDVWLSTGDGSRQFQVTSTGAYADVSQADDGTMIALTGVRLHKLDRMGNVLADFDTPVSDTRPVGSKVFWGPFDPAISPDGSKVAYTWYYMTQTQDPSCFPPECAVAINEGGTGYSRSDRQTAWDEPGFAKHSGWRNPIWADDAVTILSDPTHLPNADVVIDVHAERSGPTGFMVKNWFTDDLGGNPNTRAGDITRDKKKMAFVTGNETTLSLYAVPSFPTAFPDGEADPSTRPVVCYRYDGAQGNRFGSPTFSPDGTRLAWTESDGIRVVTVPDFSAGCTTEGASPSSSLLIAGATQPDWGPADVPAGRPQQPAGPTPGPGGPGTDPAAPAAPKLTVSRAKLATALKRGLRIRITGATPGRARLVARAKGRIVAKAKGTVAADGTLSARLRFTKAAKRKLARSRSVRLVISGAGAKRTVVLERR